MKQSLGSKTLLFPTPVLLVGTYDQDGYSGPRFQDNSLRW
jgi:hypothetical protein